mmetsp:Transcript_128953/g.223727  ORF Transcript_128953/g.223727 Transcript_128953/m.223727 type:complete len:220 (+) Transcript_128953:1942-2601(+)
MRCTVASRRPKSFRRQQVSSSALRSTSSTSFGCISTNFSTSAMPRYTRVGFRRVRPSPTVFINIRETVYLSVTTPCFCISSKAAQASSTPFRRMISSKALACPRGRSRSALPSWPAPASLPGAPPARLPAREGVATSCGEDGCLPSLTPLLSPRFGATSPAMPRLSAAAATSSAGKSAEKCLSLRLPRALPWRPMACKNACWWQHVEVWRGEVPCPTLK